MNFVVHGTTTYDGIEFPFQWSGTAEGEQEAMALAILGQTRGDLLLEFGKCLVSNLVASEFEIAAAKFKALYKGERVVDHSEAMTYVIDSVEEVIAIDEVKEVKAAIAYIVQSLKEISPSPPELEMRIADLEALL